LPVPPAADAAYPKSRGPTCFSCKGIHEQIGALQAQIGKPTDEIEQRNKVDKMREEKEKEKEIEGDGDRGHRLRLVHNKLREIRSSCQSDMVKKLLAEADEEKTGEDADEEKRTLDKDPAARMSTRKRRRILWRIDLRAAMLDISAGLETAVTVTGSMIRDLAVREEEGEGEERSQEN
jgi:hypothetical protein